MELLTLTDYFQHFLSERPAISPNRLAAELSIDRTNLQKIIKGKRRQKYGYSLVEFDGEVDSEFY